MVEQMSIPSNHPGIEALSPTQAYVLGTNGALWLENGPWGKVPPSREQVDGNVAAFQALSPTQAYVLGTNGALWLENGPWGKVPPSREQVDGNVYLRRTSSSTPPPPAYTEKSWGPFGTGPLSDSATVGSGGNECQYQVSVSIQQNGDCTFSGYYENRGNWTFPNFGTAPPQGFIVGLVVLDEAGRGYTFAYTGEVPSAPQQGAVAQWSIARNNPAIAQNWDSIAAKNYVQYFWYNRYDESIWSVIGDVASAVLSWIGQNGPSILQGLEMAAQYVEVIIEIAASAAAAEPVRPALPAGVPTGAAAAGSGGGSSGQQASAVPA
jgi:hypothetical protein